MSSYLDVENETTEKIFACECEDSSVSILVPNPNTTFSEKEWRRRHGIGAMASVQEMYSIQAPANRKHRNNWTLRDGVLIVEGLDDSTAVSD